MLKYHLNADGLLVQEKYTGSGNTVKQVSGVYVFNCVDEDRKGQFRPHQNGGLSDTHSIHAGQFNDGTFFLLALTKKMCDGHLVKDPFDSKKSVTLVIHIPPVGQGTTLIPSIAERLGKRQ